MTSEVWKARLNGGYLGPDWVKELLTDFEAAEALSYRVPTQWAYDQVCAARTKWEERVKDLEASLIQEKLALEYCGNECKLAMDKAIEAEKERDNQKTGYEKHIHLLNMQLAHSEEELAACRLDRDKLNEYWEKRQGE